MFTDKELQVAKMKLEGLKNNKIAEALSVSEADISQTLSRLSRKVKTVQDSTKLLTDIGVIKEAPKYVMTEEGRRLTHLPKKPVSIPRECELVRLSTLVFKIKGFEETSWAIYAVPHQSFRLGEGTAITTPENFGKVTRIPSTKPPTILLSSEQAQSTRLP